MPNLQKWEEKIKAKRMKTPFREFVKEVGSWWPLNLYKIDKQSSRYPDTKRRGMTTALGDFPDTWNNLTDNSGLIGEKSFFEDIKTLFKFSNKPFTNCFYGGNENSAFADLIFGVKNCYLGFAVGGGSENILYSAVVYPSCHNVFNSVSVGKSSNVYYSRNVNEGHNIFYSKTVLNSHNIWFSTNLIGCSECVLCDNLENKTYHINNTEYTKEEYLKLKKEIIGSKNFFEKCFEKTRTPSKNLNSTDVSDSLGVMNSENIDNGICVNRIKNGRNIIFVDGADSSTDFYDCIEVGINSTDFYGVGGSGTNSSNIYVSIQIGKSSNIYYSYMLENCSFCLGCIGLKNKSYCILNKQYTKEEWYELADKIFAQMDTDGTLGDFFPGSLNPFYFNDTMAYLIDDSFTKEEVEKEGYMWRDEAIKVDIPEGADIIETKDLGKYQGFDANGNWTIQEDILTKVIRDEKGNFYKIVPMELEFLRKHRLPLPEIHWLERIKMGFRM